MSRFAPYDGAGTPFDWPETVGLSRQPFATLTCGPFSPVAGPQGLEFKPAFGLDSNPSPQPLGLRIADTPPADGVSKRLLDFFSDARFQMRALVFFGSASPTRLRRPRLAVAGLEGEVPLVRGAAHQPDRVLRCVRACVRACVCVCARARACVCKCK